MKKRMLLSFALLASVALCHAQSTNTLERGIKPDTDTLPILHISGCGTPPTYYIDGKLIHPATLPATGTDTSKTKLVHLDRKNEKKRSYKKKEAVNTPNTISQPIIKLER